MSDLFSAYADRISRLAKAVPFAPSQWFGDPAADAVGGARRVSQRLRLTGAGPDERPGNGGDPFSEMRSGVRRMTDLYLDLAESMYRELATFARMDRGWPFTAREPVEEDGPLVLTGAPGHTVDGELWLKNESSTAIPRVEWKLSVPQTADGRTFGGELSVDPRVLEDIRPNANIRVRIVASVPEGTDAGTFHALLFTPELPELAKPVSIRVT
jgi:hypothetical protein